MRSHVIRFGVAVVGVSLFLAAGCGKDEAPKTQKEAMSELQKIKQEEGVDVPEISEDEARAQVDAARKQAEEAKAKGAASGHMTMDEFKKMEAEKKR